MITILLAISLALSCPSPKEFIKPVEITTPKVFEEKRKKFQ